MGDSSGGAMDSGMAAQLLQRCDCHVAGGGNGQQRPDFHTKGVNDGGTIAMGYFSDSPMDSKTVAMGDGGISEVTCQPAGANKRVVH
jgi:hypothetical protein